MIQTDVNGDITIEALVQSPFAHFPTVQRVNISQHLRQIVRTELDARIGATTTTDPDGRGQFSWVDGLEGSQS